jgi:hypothetical protein
MAAKLLTHTSWCDRVSGDRHGRAKTILSERDLLIRETPPALVDRLMIAGTLAALVSKPGMGKSFVALDLALSIAAGLPQVYGLPLRRSGPVVYVIGEGGGRFKLRVKAWKQHYGIDRSLPFRWTNGPINLLETAEVDRFIEAIREIRPSLVVVDTLSRCLVGADENSQQDMTKAVASLDRIRTSVDGLTVLVLHHLNAAGTRERGSTVLNGAVDTQLKLTHPAQKGDDDKVQEDSDHLLLSTTKQKDLDEGRSLKLAKAELSIEGESDEDGNAATSLVWTTTKRSIPLLTWISQNPGRSKSDILRAVGGNKDDLFKTIDRHANQGRLRVEVRGKTHLVYPVDSPRRNESVGGSPSGI